MEHVRTSLGKHKWHLLGVLALVMIISTACTGQTPGPTATPTRTPIIPTNTPTLTPTSTQTPTPTSTPTPTPTLPPGLLLPATPDTATSYAPLPADLYFLRGGALWLWGAEGGDLQEIALNTDSDTEIVLDYHITPDRNYIAYATDAGKLYTFDSASWESTFIPTSGDLLHDNEALFKISDDGNTIIYMAWHTHPSTEQPPIDKTAPYGTVLSVDRLQPRQRQTQLGFCTTVDDAPCAGFSLSPDQDLVIIADGRGIWQTKVSEASTTFITSTTSLLKPTRWASDNRYILFEKTGSPSLQTIIGYSLLNAGIPAKITQRTLECGSDVCQLDVSIEDDVIWLSSNGQEQGCLGQWQLSAATNEVPALITCKLAGWPLHPTDILTLSESTVRFLHHGCGPDCEGPRPGVYEFTPPDNFTAIALLPQSEGELIWSDDGHAFLYLDKSGEPTYLGTIPGSQFIDVSNMLKEAYAFSWIRPIPGQP